MDSNIADIIVSIINGVVALFVAYYGYQIKYGKSKEQDEDELKLVDHTVHKRIESYKRRIETRLIIYNEDNQTINKGKTLVLKDVLKAEMDIWGRNLQDLARNLDEGDYDIYEINKRFFDKAISEISTYMYTDNYSEEEKKILKYVVDKLSIRNERRIAYIEERIESISENNIMYPNRKNKQVAIFDAYLGEFTNVMNTYKELSDEVNGSLSGKYFNGQLIQ